jgi:hypothetical protein
MIIVNKTKVDRKAFVQASFIKTLPLFFGLLAVVAVVMVLSIIAVLEDPNVTIFCFVILMICVVFAMFIYNIRRIVYANAWYNNFLASNNNRSEAEYNCQVSDQKLTLRSGVRKIEYDFSDLEQILETRKFYAMLFSKDKVAFLDKDGFNPNSSEKFAELAKTLKKNLKSKKSV